MSVKTNMNEKYFHWWVRELEAVGLIKELEIQPEKFVLSNTVPVYYNHNYTRKAPIIKNFSLFTPITYTTDACFLISERLKNKLFGVIGYVTDEVNGKDYRALKDEEYNEAGNVYQQTLFYTTDEGTVDEKGERWYKLWFDVKPPSKALKFSGKLGSSRDFKFNQRMVFDRHNVFVNKVVPVGSKTSLYNKTFRPKRYIHTDGGTQIRKVKASDNYSNLTDYLNSKHV